MNCPNKECHYRTLTKDLKEEFCFDDSCERRILEHLDIMSEAKSHLKPFLPVRRK